MRSVELENGGTEQWKEVWCLKPETMAWDIHVEKSG